jgi:hypothetical protein
MKYRNAVVSAEGKRNPVRQTNIGDLAGGGWTERETSGFEQITKPSTHRDPETATLVDC